MSEICQIITRGIGEQFSCSTINGFICIHTPYVYPDGDFIDLYLKHQAGSYVLTDLGETFRWLSTQSLSENIWEKEEELIKDILSSFGTEKIKKNRGMLTLEVESQEKIAAAVTDLSQAVFRVSDIWFKFRPT